MRAGLVGVIVASVAGSRSRNGPPGRSQQNVVDALRPRRCGLRQALEDRRMFAVDRAAACAPPSRTAFMKQRAADHQRLLVGEQQPLAGARRCQARREAGRRRRCAASPHRRRDAPRARERLAASTSVGSRRRAGAAAHSCRGSATRRNAGATAALREQVVDAAAVRGQREHLEALGMARDHVERAGADRPVDPRMQTRCASAVVIDGLTPSASGNRQQRIDAVEHAAVPRQQLAAVLAPAARFASDSTVATTLIAAGTRRPGQARHAVLVVKMRVEGWPCVREAARSMASHASASSSTDPPSVKLPSSCPG
jgi:hypothetical protein